MRDWSRIFNWIMYYITHWYWKLCGIYLGLISWTLFFLLPFFTVFSFFSWCQARWLLVNPLKTAQNSLKIKDLLEFNLKQDNVSNKKWHINLVMYSIRFEQLSPLYDYFYEYNYKYYSTHTTSTNCTAPWESHSIVLV